MMRGICLSKGCQRSPILELYVDLMMMLIDFESRILRELWYRLMDCRCRDLKSERSTGVEISKSGVGRGCHGQICRQRMLPSS